ncbi:ZIP family metal transporter [Endomicrobium proavitum]|uniref:Zinc transporter ZupT n=1 Tax=Endomicrobium proavitum TaxID=1408281 RepID=A0A0G3WKM6_9BACT|nr:ZIP family metal transporter [Endomicrobium proavitum]AKL98442.1 Zinc transporter ZupT [Endomicrobium proavitum]
MEIIYSLIAASSALLGTAIVLKFHKWAEKNSILLINFAAGVMLAIAFAHLMPEGLAANPKGLLFVLGGFLAMFFLQFVVLFHPCHDGECHKHMGTTSVIGLSLHSLIDGLIIAVGFEANSGLGILTTLAVLLHKLPDGITISAILLHTGVKKNKIFRFSLATALFTPVGTIIGMFLFTNLTQDFLGALLSVTAGSFIFLAASDLIPETHKITNRIAPLTIFLGAAVVFLLEYFVG